ncbi:Oidioi.mRNA.OKI2018_I69.chr1.g972.t1.cds [Oikopleura dioica]|uniref:Oidioi.mRNA.OKI2018_I69.chr1.g972.t1.cds n=1 Tax=Oikopleura dioica TaxID=34765 RepID=A0ABN7SQA5_OIKDI|nr:Oidioi.mRNA.OKI2018_I69.chr1.g972.t1.cds [Oikopleura dioica]
MEAGRNYDEFIENARFIINASRRLSKVEKTLRNIDSANREINKEINKKQKKYWHLIDLKNEKEDHRVRPVDVDEDLWQRFLAFEAFERETKLSSFIAKKI